MANYEQPVRRGALFQSATQRQPTDYALRFAVCNLYADCSRAAHKGVVCDRRVCAARPKEPLNRDLAVARPFAKIQGSNIKQPPDRVRKSPCLRIKSVTTVTSAIRTSRRSPSV